MAAVIGALQCVASTAILRQHYCERDSNWASAIVEGSGLDASNQAALRRAEEAAYGLRWLELAHERQFDLRRSLVPQLPLCLLENLADAR